MSKNRFSDGERYRALSILSNHIGRQKAVGMPAFYEQIFGEQPKTNISGTRKLRFLVTDLRAEGQPICSTTNGGYYLASAGSELDDYCDRLKSQALRKLRIVSRLKRVSLQSLCTQLDLNLDINQAGL